MRSIIQAIHNLGLALWWGGTFMGTLAMNPAVEVLDDPDERDKMVDEGWALFQPWAAGGLLCAIITHIALRRQGSENASSNYKWVARLKDLLFGAAVASTLANMAMGEYVIHEDPAFLPDELENESAIEESDPSILVQQGLTPAACVQLLTGAALFVAGAFLAVRTEQ
ncbi:MAG: hypothetical protein ABI210_06980 [Abditibacteriaceae bacterium]